jgi:hypothetical protein
MLLRFIPLFLRVKERFEHIGTVYLVSVSTGESIIYTAENGFGIFNNTESVKLE